MRLRVTEQLNKSCLHYACTAGHLDVVEYLCDHGGNDFLVLRDSVSCLHQDNRVHDTRECVCVINLNVPLINLNVLLINLNVSESRQTDVAFSSRPLIVALMHDCAVWSREIGRAFTTPARRAAWMWSNICVHAGTRSRSF
jgi:hypothetical protein